MVEQGVMGSPLDKAKPRGTVALLMLLMAVMGEMCLAADFYGFAAVIKIVSADLSLSPAQAGLVQGAFGVSFALGMLFWAPRGRSMSSVRLYLIGLGGSGLLMLLQTQAQDFTQLFLLRLVVGFFDSAVWVGSMKIVMQWFAPRRQGLVLGIILAAYSLAITLDFALGLPYAMAHGWRAFFMVLGGLTLSACLITQLVVRAGPYQDPHDKIKTDAGVLRSIAARPWIWVGILAIFGALFSVAATATWLIPALIDVQKMAPEQAPLFGTIMGLSQVFFLILGGYVSDRFTRVGVMRVGMWLTILAASACVLVAWQALPYSGLLIVAILCGVGVFHGGAIFSYVGERYGVNLGPCAAGYAEMGGVFATFVAPSLLGLLLSLTGSYIWAFGSFLAVEVLVFIGFLMLNRLPSAQAE
nr:MFS transporter [Alcaligenes faecalis]